MELLYQEELKGSQKCIQVSCNRIAYRITPIPLYIECKWHDPPNEEKKKKKEFANACGTNFLALSV